MEIVAKKKKAEDAPKGSPAWMATFSDLMNLLLCFFVLLFSMSSIDAEKYAAVVASLSNSFSIFSSGGSAINKTGQLISSGISQLNNLDSYTFDTGKPVDSDSETREIDDAVEYVEKMQEEAVKKLYEEVAQLMSSEEIDSDVDISIDPNNQYVKLTISGAILFDSGETKIKDGSLPILDKIGNILKNYDDNLIKIEGHTDNVPVGSSSKYDDNMELSSARAYSVWKFMVGKKHLDPDSLEAAGRSEYNPIADNTSSAGRAKNRRVEFKIYTENYKR